MRIELRAREDGRHQVSVDGYVRWCGFSAETAQSVAAALRDLLMPRERDDRPLRAAISQRSALYVNAGARAAYAEPNPPTPRKRLYATE